MRIDIEHLKSYVLNLADKWLDLMIQKQYQEAESLCLNFIQKYGSLFLKRAIDIDENSYNYLLVFLVFFKGLHEYIKLCELTKERNWYENNSSVENVWIELCDCRERLEFASQYCQGEILDRIIHDLDGLENFFYNRFGRGIYFSPGLVFDKSLCNICYQDCRACSHVPGRLYEGKICYYKPVNPQIDHVALVETPKDRRCRIWAWQIKDNNDKAQGINIEEACILTSFSVDDFLRELES